MLRRLASIRPRHLAAALACGVVAAAPVPAALSATGSALPVERHVFTLTKQDRAALRAHRLAQRDRVKATKQLSVADVASVRIAAIQDLLDEAQDDDARLQQSLRQLAVQQYEAGQGSKLAFLLGAHDLTGVVSRATQLQDTDEKADSLIKARAASVEKLEALQTALADMRDLHGTLAADLDDHADALDDQLVAAKAVHVEAEGDDEPTAAPAGGTWYSFAGDAPAAFLLPQLTPNLGGTYSGGTLTPARPSSPQQVATILADPRITFTDAGRTDIATGQIDGRILDALELLAGRFGTVNVTMLKTGHSIMTVSGNVSEHAMGCAVDIGSLGGTVIQRSTQGPGTVTEQGVQFLAGLTGDLAPHQVISLYSYGGPSMAMADHDDHIHLGYHC